jgi:hypothetical protein
MVLNSERESLDAFIETESLSIFFPVTHADDRKMGRLDTRQPNDSKHSKQNDTSLELTNPIALRAIIITCPFQYRLSLSHFIQKLCDCEFTFLSNNLVVPPGLHLQSLPDSLRGILDRRIANITLELDGERSHGIKLLALPYRTPRLIFRTANPEYVREGYPPRCRRRQLSSKAGENCESHN